MANAKCTLIDASVEPHDILLTVMPMHHIGGKNFCTVHFHRACTNVLMPAFQPATVLQAMVKHQDSMRAAGADHDQDAAGRIGWRRLSRTGAEDRLLLFSSHARAAAAAGDHDFRRIFVQFYGLTESGPSGSMLRKEDHLPDGSEKEQRRLASAGRPQIYNEIRIVDDSWKPAARPARSARCSSAASRSCSATGTMRRPPRRRCATDGSLRATTAVSTRTAISTSWAARRT